MTKFFSVISK